MQKKPGIILIFDEPQRSELLAENTEVFGDAFSDTLSAHDWKIGDICLSLLSFEKDQFNYLALARKGKRVATSKNRIVFSSLINLNNLSIESVQRHIQARLVQYFIRSSTGTGGNVPPSTWVSIINALLIERPDIEKDLRRLESLAKYSKIIISGQRTELLIQEREALGISLDIFSGGSKLREKVLGEWAPDETSIEAFDSERAAAQMISRPPRTQSFIDGIPSRYFQEETAIQHDLSNWNQEKLLHHASGISVFKQRGRRLEVIYANRNAIENTLGVDLVYWNSLYNSFVLVQYKLMIMKKDTNEFIYRPDPQLIKELERMDDFHRIYPAEDEFTKDKEYRLTNDPFFLKLVPNQGLSPSSGELIKGMYLPRRYVQFLMGPHGPVGIRDGKIINFKNASRYLSNSEFSQNVNAGRIGSSSIQTAAISEIIETYIHSGRAVLLAKES